jgi:hypothetical protein
MWSLYARIRQLILPGTAQPDDPAIIAGPDLPPCMRAAFSSAIFFRPQGTATGGANAPPSYFIGQLLGAFSGQVAEGWLVYDQNTVCGYITTQIQTASNSGGGALNPSVLFASGAPNGVVTYNTSPRLQVGSGAGRQPYLFAVGVAANISPTQSPFTIDTVAQPRGLRAQTSSTVNSAAIGAEAVVLTTPNFTAFDGRAYKWKILGHLVASVGGNNANSFIRDTNLAGAVLGFVSVPCGVAGPFYKGDFEGYFKRVAGSDRVMNLVQTASASAGTTIAAGAATAVRSLEVYDAGAATDFPNAIAV